MPVCDEASERLIVEVTSQAHVQELAHNLRLGHRLTAGQLLQDDIACRSEDHFLRRRTNSASGIFDEQPAADWVVGIERDGILHSGLSSAGRDCRAILRCAAGEEVKRPAGLRPQAAPPALRST